MPPKRTIKSSKEEKEELKKTSSKTLEKGSPDAKKGKAEKPTEEGLNQLSSSYIDLYPKVRDDIEKKFDLYDQLCKEENRYRELYAQKRDSKVLDDPHLNLIAAHDAPPGFYDIYKETDDEKKIPRVFEEWMKPKKLKRIVRAKEGEAEQIEEDDIVVDPRPKAGSTIVNSKEFTRNFEIFTEGQFRWIDWNNVFVAGGSVLAALMPVPEGHNLDNRTRRKYYHEMRYPNSDIDIFLYGLDEEGANKKLVEIYESIKDSVSSEVICFRSKHAVSIVSQYPYRHIQVILRLYKSPAEVLMGFDVDACSVGYDGDKVWMTPRAHRALTHRYNTIDMERRSPSYEIRLSKYAERGFTVLVPTLERKKIDVQLLERRYDQLQGLAKLLLMEAVPSQEARNSYKETLRQLQNRPAFSLRKETVWNSLTGEEDEVNNEKEQNDEEDEDKEFKGKDTLDSDYSTVFLPWGPQYPASKLAKLMYSKDMILNSHWYDPEKTHHTHPCFFGEAEKILGDCCGHCPPVPPELEDPDAPFVSGKLTWIVVNPGAQAKIGSFHPITEGDWTEGAYLNQDVQSIIQKSNDNDIEGLKKILAQNKGDKDKIVWDVNGRDMLGRTPLMIATFVGATKAAQFLIQNGARISAHMPDGRTCLHIAAEYGFDEIVELILARKEELDKEQADSSDEAEVSKGSKGKKGGKAPAKKSSKKSSKEEEDEDEMEEDEGDEPIDEMEEDEDEEESPQKKKTHKLVSSKKRLVPKKAAPKKKTSKKKYSSSNDEDESEMEEEEEEDEDMETEEKEEGDDDFEQIKRRIQRKKQKALEKGEILDILDIEGVEWDTNTTALEMAIVLGHVKVASLLLQKMTLTSASKYYQALANHPDMISVLLDSGFSLELPPKNKKHEQDFVTFCCQGFRTDALKVSFEWCKKNGNKFKETWDSLSNPEGIFIQMLKSLVQRDQPTGDFHSYGDENQIKTAYQDRIKEMEKEKDEISKWEDLITEEQYKTIEFLVSVVKVKVQYEVKKEEVDPKLNEQPKYGGPAKKGFSFGKSPKNAVKKTRRGYNSFKSRKTPAYLNQSNFDAQTVINQQDQPIAIAVAKGSPRLVQLLLKHGADPILLVKEKAFVCVSLARESLNDADQQPQNVKNEIKNLEKHRKKIKDGKEGENENEDDEEEETEEEMFFRDAEYQMLVREIQETKKGTFWNNELCASKEKKFATSTEEKKEGSKDELDNQRALQLLQNECSLEIRKRNLVLFQKLGEFKKIVLKQMEEACKSPPISFKVEFFEEVQNNEEVERDLKEIQKENEEYLQLFNAVFSGNVEEVRKLTTKRPIGQQLHVVCKAEHSQRTTLDVAVANNDSKMVTELLKIAKEQYTPLPTQVKDDKQKLIPFNNFDLMNSGIRPGDYLDAYGKIKKKKGKKVDKSEVGFQINCLVSPKKLVGDETMQHVIQKGTPDILSALIYAFPDDDKWVVKILSLDVMSQSITSSRVDMAQVLFDAASKVPKPKDVAIYEGLDVGGKKSDWADEHRGKKNVLEEDVIQLSIEDQKVEMLKFFADKPESKPEECGYIYKTTITPSHYDQVINEKDNDLQLLKTLIQLDTKVHQKDKDYAFNRKTKGEDSSIGMETFPTQFAIVNAKEKAFTTLAKDAKAKLPHNPLQVALATSNFEIVKAVLEVCSDEQVRELDENGDTALSVAAADCEEKFVKLLLDDGRIDPLIRNKKRFTALDLSVNRGRIKNFEILQPKYSKDILEKENSVGRTPFDSVLAKYFQERRNTTESLTLQRPQKRILASPEDTLGAVRSILETINTAETVETDNQTANVPPQRYFPKKKKSKWSR